MTIPAQNDKVVESGKGETSARSSWNAAEDVEYKLCFSVQGTRGLLKRLIGRFGRGVYTAHVAFSVHQEATPGEKMAKSAQVDKVWDKIARATESVDRIKDQLTYMAITEEHQATINDSTNASVLYWAVFEAVGVVAVTGLQVTYMRQFFETRRRL